MTISTLSRPVLDRTQAIPSSTSRLVEIEVSASAIAVDLRPYAFGSSIRRWALLTLVATIVLLAGYLFDARGLVAILAEFTTFSLSMLAFHVLRFALTTPDGYQRWVRPKRALRLWV